MARLEATEIVAGYGKIRVLDGVSLTVQKGAITCILGPNGSGKSTLLKTVAGVLKPWHGQVVFEGERIDVLPTHQIIRKGIATMPQGGGVLSDLSVAENLLMGAYTCRSRPETERRLEAVYARFPALRQFSRKRAGNLSGGQQLLLSFGRVLMAAPKMVLLDEPSVGLAPAIVKDVWSIIGGLRDEGIDFLLVEQNVRQALQIADFVVIMAQGRNQFLGTPAELGDQDLLMKTYLGVRSAR